MADLGALAQLYVEALNVSLAQADGALDRNFLFERLNVAVEVTTAIAARDIASADAALNDERRVLGWERFPGEEGARVDAAFRDLAAAVRAARLDEAPDV